jgi:hypothetical protein
MSDTSDDTPKLENWKQLTTTVQELLEWRDSVRESLKLIGHNITNLRGGVIVGEVLEQLKPTLRSLTSALRSDFDTRWRLAQLEQRLDALMETCALLKKRPRRKKGRK